MVSTDPCKHIQVCACTPPRAIGCRSLVRSAHRHFLTRYKNMTVSEVQSEYRTQVSTACSATCSAPPVLPCRREVWFQERVSGQRNRSPESHMYIPCIGLNLARPPARSICASNSAQFCSKSAIAETFAVQNIGRDASSRYEERTCNSFSYTCSRHDLRFQPHKGEDPGS